MISATSLKVVFLTQVHNTTAKYSPKKPPINTLSLLAYITVLFVGTLKTGNPAYKL
jgi:hypothetical protein